MKEGELAEHGSEKGFSLGVVGVLEIKHQWDMRFDVGHVNGQGGGGWRQDSGLDIGDGSGSGCDCGSRGGHGGGAVSRLGVIALIP